jgi:hypothetical protein
MISIASNILASGGEWIGFAVLIGVWALGALANWIKKQTEQQSQSEVRRQVRETIQRKALERQQALQRQVQAARQSQQPVPRISAGVAKRFPDVLLPPAPQQRKAVPPPQQRRAAPPPQPRRQIPTPPQRTSQPQRPAPADAALIVLEEDTAPSTQHRNTTSAHTHDIAAWLKPRNLRQLYILTEVLQPPVALRENFLIDSNV